MALAAKLDRRSYRVFTLLGDGELDEGSNWEASMAAAHDGRDLTFIACGETVPIAVETARHEDGGAADGELVAD